MRIIPVPVRSDNYAYLLVDEPSQLTAVIDPFDAKKVIETAEKQNLKLTPTILTTHHHQDHSGGNRDFIQLYKTQYEPCHPLPPPLIHHSKSVKVYGGSHQIPELTDLIQIDDFEFKFGDSIKIKCLLTNCHTQDSICYFVEDQVTLQRGVFTGDTLFIAGCGRFFEGTPEQMNRALNVKLSSLPDDTLTYIGHEYTKSNVRFGKSIERDNVSLKNLESFCQSHSITTGQFTIQDEKNFNVFMRLNQPEIIRTVLNHNQSIDSNDSNQIIKELRLMKDQF